MPQRVAFITGAARGLGHATVRAFLGAGWDVFFTYRNSREEACELLEEANRLGRRAAARQVDLMDKQAVLDAVHACLREFSHVDALVHNFGPFVFERVALAEYTDDMWQRMMTGNLDNFFWMYRALIAQMRRRAFGRIITIGYDGAGGAVGWRFRAAYAAAKAGLASLTRSIAREERQNGITANMVCPGDIRGAHKAQLIREVARPFDPLGRPPVGEDVSRLIVFLCEPNSQQVNGTVTEVTGGYDILAYDDGKDVVAEEPLYGTGDAVWVFPWDAPGRVLEAARVPNRHVVYRVESGTKTGSFTAAQLAHFDGE